MDGIMILSVSLLMLVIGTGVGYLMVGKGKRDKIEAENQKRIREAESQISQIEKKGREIEKQNHELLRNAEQEAQKIKNDAKDEIAKKERALEKESVRIEEREKTLDEKFVQAQEYEKNLKEEKDVVVSQQQELSELLEQEAQKLEEVAKLSKEEAKEELLANIEKTSESDLVNKMRRLDERVEKEKDSRARTAIVNSIQRLASDVTTETTVTNVELESDDLKGRIIGKEGRNINSFERITGVNLVIDDTPGTVIISSFDPMRRYIASEVLKELVADGRISPARIEEVMRKKTMEVDKMIEEEGERAVFETGVTGLPKDMIKILGRLKFRTSYGQNVLQHSIEVAFIAEALANEVGADPKLAKKAGLLHDIGKTVSHEIGGKHAVLSGEIARKYELDEVVVNAIEAHHEDFPMNSPEACIIQAADAISASRPGARRETSEKFIKRMMELEGIATSFKGVEKCYAMQAGREMWIFVNPEELSDLDTSKLSWDLTRRIEEDMQYPGEIKVVVFRESRFIHTAK